MKPGLKALPDIWSGQLHIIVTEWVFKLYFAELAGIMFQSSKTWFMVLECWEKYFSVIRVKVFLPYFSEGDRIVSTRATVRLSVDFGPYLLSEQIGFFMALISQLIENIPRRFRHGCITFQQIDYYVNLLWGPPIQKVFYRRLETEDTSEDYRAVVAWMVKAVSQ